DRLARADALLAEARLVMDEANAAEERSGENADGITEFARNKNVKFCLTMTDDGGSWTLNVQKDGSAAEIAKADGAAVAEELKQVFSESGYTPDDTILIEMVYDGDQVGTNTAYRTVDEALSEVAREYKHCFCSKIDLSDFSE
ncbi:MAG: biopolymer transporter ExbD, partial [Eubacterium sp.]|nr:biopolymer transporter ExbD [Eubacterium sp.]